MEMLGPIGVLIHLIGFAALFGGVLVQGREPDPEVNASMLWGAWIELLSGAGLVALQLVNDQPVHYAPLAIKLGLTLFVVLLVTVNRKYESIPRGLWAIIGAATLINAGLAVLWQ